MYTWMGKIHVQYDKNLLQQESGKHRIPVYGSESDHPEQYITSVDCYVPPSAAASSSSPSGGLACAIAALAERQQMSGGSPSLSCAVTASGNLPTTNPNMLPSCSSYYSPSGPAVETSHEDGEWNVERGSEIAEEGTSYRSSDSREDDGGITNLPQQHEDAEDEGLQSLPPPHIPESFEEQMMLAKAVSLAEARAVTSGPGITWH